MKLYIKNMVCNRCRMAVRDILEKAGLHPLQVELGEVSLATAPSAAELEQIDRELEALGFERIDDRRSRVIEKIKTLIIRLVHEQNGQLRTNLSDYLSQELRLDYKYLSALFSEIEGTTIEKYYIAQRTERVKELLVYDELSLSEIAFRLNYSSVAHLSSQFKKVTGLTPTHFRDIRQRKPLDQV